MGQHHIRMVNIGDDPAQPMFDFDYVRTSFPTTRLLVR